MPLRSLAAARDQAAALGLNLFGVVDASRFDRCQPHEQRVARVSPACGTILVLGSGGRAFWQSFASQQPQAANAAAPAAAVAAADAHGWRGACDLAASLQQRGFIVRALQLDLGCRLNLGRLGEAAGFGTVSPVSGLLLHPDFGPWLRLRAALLIDGMPFGTIADASISDRFQPCCNCDRPCVAACPAHAVAVGQPTDLGRCATHRHEGGCVTSCCTRTACPLGSGHQDAPGEAAHAHAFRLPALQRRFGLGVWRFVPGLLRDPR